MGFVWETPEEIDLAIAKRVRNIRRRRGISQQKLSEKSNVSLGSIKRFESSGQISLISLTRIACALDCTADLKRLFTDVPYNSIREVINERR
ncbi:MAG: helix-turn-helix transcriptional regulator [Clostridia bacterium]|nr:helix-turn-helix transcriptional regulator [Clostridia bacterium]